jgi:putative oxidoreductase
VHLPNGWVFTSQGGGWEYPVFLIVASLALWLIGDGAFALRRSNRFVPGGACAVQAPRVSAIVAGR